MYVTYDAVDYYMYLLMDMDLEIGQCSRGAPGRQTIRRARDNIHLCKPW